MPATRVDEFTPEQEQFITEVASRVARRHAEIIERLATELHALIMVLAEKRLITLEQLRAAKSRLDLAFEVTQARQLRAAISDLERLDDELDEGDSERRSA
jgi:hypothetical protein